MNFNKEAQDHTLIWQFLYDLFKDALFVYSVSALEIKVEFIVNDRSSELINKCFQVCGPELLVFLGYSVADTLRLEIKLSCEITDLFWFEKDCKGF